MDSLTCLKSRLIMCLSFSYTVGIRNPNKFGFRMIKSRSVVEWSGFRMVLDPPFKNRTKMSGFRMVLDKMAATIRKPDILVRFSNGFGLKWLPFCAKPFEIRPSKCSVFECFRFSNVRYSDPHCTSAHSNIKVHP